MATTAATHHAHGDRQYVVDQQGRARDQTGRHSEVVLADDVRAAALRIRPNRLAVRAHDDRDQNGDGDADRDRVAQGDCAGQDQDEQDFFGRVRDRGERVRGENRERRRLAEALVARLGGRERASDEETLQPAQTHGLIIRRAARRA
jgi:hypothetical protein